MKRILFIVCSLIFMTALQAQIINVPADYSTIQQGINAANPGDTVLVADGTYYEQINFLGKKPLVVASHYLTDGDTSHISQTIIDASQWIYNQSASVVLFKTGEDTTSILCGFTITHGRGSLNNSQGETFRTGGGIFISSSGAKIIHNHITENHLLNTLSGNTYYATGGGIGVERNPGDQWVIISDNVIDHNSCTSNNMGATGGGITVFCNSRIVRNDISNNTCTGTANAYAWGGGIESDVPSAMIDTQYVEHNHIYGNLVTTNNNLALSSAADFTSAVVNFSDNVVENNKVESHPTNNGGAIMMTWLPLPGSVTRNNIFLGNISNIYGGLIFQSLNTTPNPTQVLVENNYFINNESMRGSAFISIGTPALLINNVFSGNHAGYAGGAVYCWNDNPGFKDHMLTLINNSFFGNTANEFGGAIYTDIGMNAVRPLIINSLLYGDTASVGSEVSLAYSSDTVEIANSDIDFSLIQGTSLNGGGNINADPLLTDWENLIPVPWSPLVDAGVASFVCACGETHSAPAFDMLGAPRPNGVGYDIGAYDTAYSLLGIRHQNLGSFSVFPNPFRHSTTFRYRLDQSVKVNLRIYDSFGRPVEDLMNGIQSPGLHQVTWNAESFPAGIYFLRLVKDKTVETVKLIKQ